MSSIIKQCSFRPAVVEDLNQILAIEREAYKSAWTYEGFLSEIEKPYAQFLVLTDDESDSVILGYVIFWVIDHQGRILNIAVNPKFRKKGFGDKILRFVTNQSLSEGAESIELEVRVSNEPAIQLYQKLGYFVEYLRKRFYSDGEDAYLMRLNLTGSKIDF